MAHNVVASHYSRICGQAHHPTVKSGLNISANVTI